MMRYLCQQNREPGMNCKSRGAPAEACGVCHVCFTPMDPHKRVGRVARSDRSECVSSVARRGRILAEDLTRIIRCARMLERHYTVQSTDHTGRINTQQGLGNNVRHWSSWNSLLVPQKPPLEPQHEFFICGAGAW
jgi:hypothetical protein